MRILVTALAALLLAAGAAGAEGKRILLRVRQPDGGWVSSATFPGGVVERLDLCAVFSAPSGFRCEPKFGVPKKMAARILFEERGDRPGSRWRWIFSSAGGYSVERRFSHNGPGSLRLRATLRVADGTITRYSNVVTISWR